MRACGSTKFSPPTRPKKVSKVHVILPLPQQPCLQYLCTSFHWFYWIGMTTAVEIYTALECISWTWCQMYHNQQLQYLYLNIFNCKVLVIYLFVSLNWCQNVNLRRPEIHLLYSHLFTFKCWKNLFKMAPYTPLRKIRPRFSHFPLKMFVLLIGC